ncbi:MAG: FecR domain-containing protein [Proteobacteria bacterium]|nr:FecR domain-containing protein [Pseudomonadota bacterium]
MMKKYSFFTVIVVFLLLATTNSFADSVGTLLLQRGIIKLQRGELHEIYRETGRRIQVANGDRIQTGPNTRVKIEFLTEDSTELFSDTFFTILVAGEENTSLSMPTGKGRFKVKKSKRTIGKRRRFRLRTANASIGVKGTDFVLGSVDGKTSLLTISGIVTLANIATPEVTVSIAANQASQIRQDAKPTAPIVVPPQLQEKIIESDSAKAFEDVTFGAEISGTQTAKRKKASQAQGNAGEAAPEEGESGEFDDGEIDEIVEIIEDIEETVEEAVEEIREETATEGSIRITIDTQ